MKAGWKQIRLSDLIDNDEASLQTGPFGTQLKRSEYVKNGAPMISVKEIKNGYLDVTEWTPRLAKSTLDRLPRFVLSEGDIVFARKGGVERSARIKSGEDGYFLGSDGIRLRLSDSVDSSFIGYQIRTPKIASFLVGNAEGSTMPSVNQNVLRRIPLVIPSLPVQRRVAAVLGALDDAIELNRKMNANLEAQAQALFKSWFLDFEPWGGKMPKGWKKIALSEIADFNPGYSYKGNELQPSRVAMATIKNYERRGGFKLDGFKEIVPSSKLKESQTVEVFDTLVAHTDMTQNADVIGNAEIVLSNGGYDKLIMSMDLVKVVPKRGISRFLIAALLKNPVFKTHCLGYVNGTTVLHMSKSALAEYRLRFPGDAKCLDGVSKSFEAIYRMMAMNIEESRKLAETRDALLPKLMSGEVEVV